MADLPSSTEMASSDSNANNGSSSASFPEAPKPKVKTASNSNPEVFNGNNETRKRTRTKRIRKRKAASLPININAKIGKHIIHCSAFSLFSMNKIDFRTLVEILKKVQQPTKLQCKESAISRYELGMNDTYYDMIICPMEQNETLKLSLPPDKSLSARSNQEIANSPCVLNVHPSGKCIDDNDQSVIKRDSQIKQIVETILLPQNDCKDILNIVIGDLNEAVEFIGFSNRWNWFGSYLNGLVCKDSDIDIFYECIPETVLLDNVPQDLPQKLWTFLQAHEKFRGLQNNAYAPVPSIILLSLSVRKVVRIAFSNELQVGNSSLIRIYTIMSPDLKYLTVFLKLILKKYGMHQETGGRVTTYVLFWLVAFFMQQRKLLPAVNEVRKSAKILHSVAGWDCSLPEDYSYPTEAVSLYSLLLDFAAFYRDFDFLKYVISPYLGRVLLLSDFERLENIPTDEFSVYIRHLRNPEQLTFCRNAINMQDPSDLSFNIAGELEVKDVNFLKIVCHRLCHVLPWQMQKIREMDCLCEILPKKIESGDYNKPLEQYCQVVLLISHLDFDKNRERKLNQAYLLEAVRKVMELVFKFEKKSLIISQDVTQAVISDEGIIKKNFPIMYFEYCSTVDTWKENYMKKIIPFSEKSGEKPAELYLHLTCEVRLEMGEVRIFGQSDIKFIEFLQVYLLKLLWFTLSEIVPF